MNIFVTGSTGLIGSVLCPKLSQHNHNVYKLNRIQNSLESSSPEWNLEIKHGNQSINAEAIVHLAGENIAAKRWNHDQKQKIYSSRIQGTKNLVAQIIANPNKPKTFLCASAIGFYGDRDNELLDETSAVGENFVSKVSHDWEQATLPLVEHGIRVVNLRFGVILSKKGGALNKMLTPFKLGLGGATGSGNQKFSWITIDDAINAIVYILGNPNIIGPVNLTAPNPVSNRVFTKTLAKTLNRPAFFNMPAFMCRLLFGEMANELLLSSQSVMPKKLIQNGFSFSQLDLESALTKVLE